MQSLWQRTSSHFWRVDALWLPVMTANLIGFCLLQSRSYVLRAIRESFFTQQSVLVGSMGTDTTHQSLGLALGALGTAVIVYADVLVWICALFFTAKILNRRLQTSGAEPLPVRWHRIFGLSLRWSAILFVGFSAFMIAATYRFFGLLVLRPYFTQGLTLIMFLLCAYMIIPTTLRSLMEPDGVVVDDGAKMQGRYAAGLAVTVSFMAITILDAMERSMTATPIQWTLISLAGSIIASVPYVAVSIAFALLTAPEASKHEELSALSSNE